MTDNSTTNNVLEWMQLSITLGKQSVSEGGATPSVGVVVVRNGIILGESFRGKTGPGDHAEYGVMKILGEGNLQGATVFTTLEPCSRRSITKVPCATRLIEAKVHTVYIGMFDPNPVIYRKGWRMLRDAGLTLRDYPDSLRSQIENDNKSFLEAFKISTGRQGTATFDYMQNGGNYELRHEDLIVKTRWVQSGKDSIQAIDYQQHVALAQHAQQFEEIHDPGALNWSNYTVRPKAGEIVVFRTAQTYALIQITKVSAGPDWDDDQTLLQFKYELRRRIQIDLECGGY